VPLDNIWSGSGYRNICPTAISSVQGRRSDICLEGGKIYPHDFTMSHFLIALFVAIDTMLVVSSNPAGNFRESAR
jgi:hypothetical protein